MVKSKKVSEQPYKSCSRMWAALMPSPEHEFLATTDVRGSRKSLAMACATIAFSPPSAVVSRTMVGHPDTRTPAHPHTTANLTKHEHMSCSRDLNEPPKHLDKRGHLKDQPPPFSVRPNDFPTGSNCKVK
jgi:hypothetical protein